MVRHDRERDGVHYRGGPVRWPWVTLGLAIGLAAGMLIGLLTDELVRWLLIGGGAGLGLGLLLLAALGPGLRYRGTHRHP